MRPGTSQDLPARPAIEGVLFDLDGTLVDHDGAAASAVERALAAVPVPAERWLRRRWAELEERAMGRYLAGELTFAGQRRSRITSLAAELGLGSWDDATADAWFVGYLAHYEAAWRAYDDVRPMFCALDPHLRLGVLTNGDADQQRRKLRRTGLSAALSIVVASSEVGVAKPDPEIFRRGCAALGLPPSRVAYVGDRLDTDAVAATRAGLYGIWLDRADRAASPPPAIGTPPTATALPSITTPPTITTLSELSALLAQ
jgi:putative hydrolase of the HAD superfamily